jgi:hypothetical protein
MIAQRRLAMPGTYWHNDDFLFEIRFPTTGEKPKDSRAADELLERFLRRRRLQKPCTPITWQTPSFVNGALRADIFARVHAATAPPLRGKISA